MQEIYEDEHGTYRFKGNEIVRMLLDTHLTIDLDFLARIPSISREDHEQFAQLIGYSVGGFKELSYVSDDARAEAQNRIGVMRATRMVLDGNFGEPWRILPGTEDMSSIVSDSGVSGSGHSIADMAYRDREAERIVACVNACAGLTPDQIEEMRKLFDHRQTKTGHELQG